MSSYNTSDREELRDALRSFPSPASLAQLHRYGIRSVVVLRDRVAGTPFEAALDVRTQPGITRREIGPDVLWSIE
ncbi:hypothetical protein [Dactylosporangium sp. CA-233914]|uniref:hypothetical protein n=1 Tax=Dactylosporangium sp. CA-233914 TaxID=3239934 RepID=UPI003D93A911